MHARMHAMPCSIIKMRRIYDSLYIWLFLFSNLARPTDAETKHDEVILTRIHIQ